MEQYWTNERNEIPRSELEFWAIRRGVDTRASRLQPRGFARLALKRTVAAAWLAIALGFGMEALILAGKVSAGDRPPVAEVMIELAQGVTWSFLVCAGIGLGAALAKVHRSIGGMVGLIWTPVAAGIARISRSLMAGTLGAAGNPVVLSLTTVGVLRAIEYGVLGWALASLAARDGTMRRFLTAGALVGVLFGGPILLLTLQAALSKGMALDAGQTLAAALNELVFPIGVALVIHIAMQVGRSMPAAPAKPK